MITAAQLNIKIASEGAQQATADLRGVGNAVETTGQQSLTGAQRFGAAGQMIRGVGMGLTASVTAPILALGTGIVGMASDSNEALSAVTQVYGSAAQTVIDTSRNAATAVGMSQTQYLSATTQLAAYGNMMGLTEAQTATFADQTVTAAADLASFYNTSPEDAMGAITAGLRGEGDALERYGIIMNQATVEAYALEQGIWDGTSAMTTQQLETARSGFIMSQLTSETGSANAAQGDFARTSGGLANQQRILKAELKDVAAQFGQVLLPIALKMVGVFQKVIGVMADMSPHAKAITVVIAGIAAAIGPALVGIGAMMGPLANGFRVARIAMLAFTGPIGLIVAALIGLGIAYKTNFLGFGDAVRAVGNVLLDFGRYIKAVVQDGDYLNDWLTGIPGPIRGVVLEVGKIIAAIMDFGRYIRAVVEDGDYLNDWLMGIPEPFRGVVLAVGKLIAGFQEMASAFQFFRAIGADPVTAALAALGFAFPALQSTVMPLIDGVNRLKDAFAEDGLTGVLKVIPGLIADAIAGLAGMALDFGGWVINVGAPAVIAWVWDAMAGIKGWIEGQLGIGPDAALARANEGGSAVPLTWSGWALGIGEAAISWVWDAITGIGSWIAANLGIGTGGGLAASPDGIPTGGSTEALTWSGWALGIGEAAISWIWDAVTGISGWIKANLGIGTGGGLAASPDGIPTGGSTAALTWAGWALGIGEAAISWIWQPIAGIMEWIRSKIGGAAGDTGQGQPDAASGGGGNTIDWGDWGINVLAPAIGRILAAGWDFLTLVTGKIIDMAKSAANWVFNWNGWSLAIDKVVPIAKDAWSFLGTVTTALIGWAASAAGWVFHWGAWTLDILQGGVTNGFGVVVDWLGPKVLEYIGKPLIQFADYLLELAAPPSANISLADGFSIQEAWDALTTDMKLKLSPKIEMDITAVGAQIGSWINGALTSPETYVIIAAGLALFFAGIFVGPGALIFAGLAAVFVIAQPAIVQALSAFFTGLFDGIDFDGILNSITYRVSLVFAGVIDSILMALNAAPDWAVPDGLISELEGWSDDLRTVGGALGKDFSAAFTDSLGNDYNPSDLGTGYQKPPPKPTPGGGGTDRFNGQQLPDFGSLSGGGGMFGGFITASTEARTRFTEVMTGITTDSGTMKTGVVASLTGMATEGLPQVTGLSTLSAGEFAKLHAAGLMEATGLGVDVKTRFADMQLGASGSATALNAGVSAALAGMKGTGLGHVNALSSQSLGSFASLKTGATGAAGQTSTDVVARLGAMATGGAQKAADMMSGVKGNIANSGAAGTAYSVGVNIGAGLRDGLNAMAYDVGVAAANIIGLVDGAMRKKAMIRSPSQMTQAIGSYLGKGLIVGLDSTVTAVGASATAMIGTVESALKGLGGFRDIAAWVQTMNNVGPRSGNRFYDGLNGVSRVSGAGTLNETSTTVADTMKVIAEHFDEIFTQGEYGSDALTALPTKVMSDLAMAVGKVMAPYEGNATVIESAYTALKNLVGDGAVRGAFALVPAEMQSGLVALAKDIRDTFANGNLPIATNLYAVLRETNGTILTAMTKQATDFRAQFDAQKAAGGSLASKGTFGFGIANDAMAATLSDAGKEMLRAAQYYQHVFETATTDGMRKVGLDAVKRIGADFGKAGYSYRIFEDGSLVLDAVKALSAAATAPSPPSAGIPTPPVTAPAAPYVPSTPAKQPVTNNFTYFVTLDAKNVEDFLRAVNFIDSLPAARSLVFGSNGGAS